MAVANKSGRAYWLKLLHQWHWISAAACLLGMLLFSITGITLNHATLIRADPRITTQKLQLPPALLALAQTAHADVSQKPTLPIELQRWLAEKLSVNIAGYEVERSPEEIYIALPRPGGDAWLRIGLADGAVEHEITERGWIAYLNDLHKGRHTGDVWRWFIDVFAAACLVFSLTGLFILKLHAAHRPTTWPMVGLGLAIPILLAIFFIH